MNEPIIKTLSQVVTGMRFLLCLGLIAMALLGGCGKKEAVPEASQPVEVSVVTVTARDTPFPYEFVGQTQSTSQVQIRARVSGFLDKQVYLDGSTVKAGDVMFLMDQKPFQAALDAARGALAEQQARLQVARDNLKRVQPLVALNALSQKDLDDATGQKQAAEAAVLTAGANVEQAELNLGYTRITTPVTGVSSYASVNIGSYIDQANSLLTYVAPLDPIYVNFSISENQLLKFRAEQKQGLARGPEDRAYEVEVLLADGSIHGSKGRVTFEAPDYNLQTGTFLLRATIPNPEGTLRPGQFVRVRMLGVVRLNAILVPQLAVLQGAQGHFVILVDKDGKAQVRSVEVGPWSGADVFITHGLTTGDRVVVGGMAQLSPGAAVTVTEPAPAAGDTEAATN
jgi:membrane fusion protein, multidrug efflux system